MKVVGLRVVKSNVGADIVIGYFCWCVKTMVSMPLAVTSVGNVIENASTVFYGP